MSDLTKIVLAAIAALVVVQSAAIAAGLNGVVLKTTLSMIGGLAGYGLKSAVDKARGRK